MKNLALSILLIISVHVNGQTKCRYPFSQSADSLVKFVISDIYDVHSSTQINAKFNSEEFKKQVYHPNVNVNHDSIFKVIINDLREKLGNELLCSNVDLYINSFSISNNTNNQYKYKNNYTFSVGFTYPILKREEPITIGESTSNYERINLEYKYFVNPNGKVSIEFPTNVPDCNGKANCNIYVTREVALEIMDHWGLIKETDIVRMFVDGNNWEITLTSGNVYFRNLKINIQTGRLWDFYESSRRH